MSLSPTVRRVLGLVAVAVLVAVACTFAGRWQWDRGTQRERAVDTVRANFSASPVALDTILPDARAPLDDADEWRPVTVTGRYAPGATVLLRNRPVDGRPAFHLLVPFHVEDPASTFDGTTLVVDRGWVPVGTDATGDVDVPAPPPGTVTAEVRLRTAERPATREAPAGQAHAISPGQVAAAAGVAPDAVVVEGAYGALVAEVPAPAEQPLPLALPSTDYGPHRSYALQWWIFAAGALGGFGMLAVREVRGVRADPDDDAPARERAASPSGGPPGTTPSRPPRPARPSRVRRRPTAEEEEDALIDAQLHGAPD